MGLLKKYHQIRNHFNLRRYLKLYPLTCSGSADSFNFAALHHLVSSKMDGKLGDCQVITAFICNLKQQFPKLRITVICPQNVAAIFSEVLQVQVVQIPPRAEPAAVKQAISSGDLLHDPCDALLTTEPNFRGRDFCLHSLLQPKFLIGIETGSGTVNLNLRQRNMGRHISLWFEDLLSLWAGLLSGSMNICRCSILSSCSRRRSCWARAASALPPGAPAGTAGLVITALWS